jgi:glycosyltransferase involved in cell wall biosynthesis
MRWLVLASSLTSQNGYGVLCGSVAEELRRIPGTEWDFLTADSRRSWWPGRMSLKSEWVASYPRLWFLFAAFDFLVLSLVARGKYDGVLVMVEHYAAAGWLFARWRKVACAIIQCGTYAVKLPHEIPFFHKVLEKADRVMPISHYTRKRMEERGIRARYSVVTLGVDLRRFRPAVGAVKKREVLFVGNLKSRKGIDFLLEAVAEARRSVPGIRIRAVGRFDRESPAFQSISGRIAGLGLDVEFMGSLSHDQLVEAYSSVRLNVLPSKSEGFFFEGFGLIHLEANACGTLTAGTLESGNEDAVQSGFGILVRYGDVHGLSRYIVEAMTIEPYPLLQAEKLQTWEEVARRYVGVLSEASGQGAEAAGKKGASLVAAGSKG